MRTLTAEHPAQAVGSDVRGVVRVHARAIDAVVREASAAVVGVHRGQVHVNVADEPGGLSVRLATRLPIPDLTDAAAVAATTPVAVRVREIQQELAVRLGALTGRNIRRISVVITGALVQERRRAR